MSGAAPHPRQAPIAAWVAQMIGTLVIAAVVLAFVKAMGAPFAGSSHPFQRYILGAIVAAAFPALMYLRGFRRALNADEAAVRTRGTPDPDARALLTRRLAVGGALCELPMAVGALHLFFGGESRWFIGATLVTLAVRLSYRPFTKA